MTTTDQINSKNNQTLVNQILRLLYTPTSVVVNDKGDIIYITGRTGKYLEPAAGKANWNIYAMARDGLHQVLPGAFRKAMLSFDAVLIHNIKVGNNGGDFIIDVSVQRIENPKSSRGMIIVIFTDVSPIIASDIKKPKTKQRSSIGRVKELEFQLQQSFEDMHRLRQEMQISQEELISVNEALRKSKESLYNIASLKLERSETIQSSIVK